MRDAKFERAKREALVGQFPQTFADVWQFIPDAARRTLTARQLAELADAMHALYRRGKLDARGEVVDEGGIWDGAQMRKLL